MVLPWSEVHGRPDEVSCLHVICSDCNSPSPECLLLEVMSEWLRDGVKIEGWHLQTENFRGIAQTPKVRQRRAICKRWYLIFCRICHTQKLKYDWGLP